MIKYIIAVLVSALSTLMAVSPFLLDYCRILEKKAKDDEDTELYVRGIEADRACKERRKK